MMNFIIKQSKSILILFGIITASVGVLIFFPKDILSAFFGLTLLSPYLIIIQHWAFLIMLIGLLLIYSAFKVHFRQSVIILALFSKSFYILLFIYYHQRNFAQGFLPSVIIDTGMITYFIFYLVKSRN